MELLESQSPEKKRLIETSDRHKRALEKEISAVSEKTERMLRNGLIIGGSLLLTYFVVSSLSGGKKKKRKAKKAQAEILDTEDEDVDNSEPSLISQIGNRVINHASAILLDIAKEKLAEYLSSRKKDDENT